MEVISEELEPSAQVPSEYKDAPVPLKTS